MTGDNGRSILFVGEDAKLAGILRDHLPEYGFYQASDYVAAVGEGVARTPSAVIVAVEAGQGDADRAVTGLRAAVGPNVPIVLCCDAAAEPDALRAIKAGADDYVVTPIRPTELRRAIERVPVRTHTADTRRAETSFDASAPSAPSASSDSTDSLDPVGHADARAATRAASANPDAAATLEQITRVLTALVDEPPERRVGLLVEAIRSALQVAWVRLVVDGTVVETPGAGGDPEFIEPLPGGSARAGHIAVGPAAEANHIAGVAAATPAWARLAVAVLRLSADRQRLERWALTDELTGLGNRRFLERFVQERIDRARQDGTTVTLLMFDIDDFKSYNDAFGHGAGDEILRSCGVLFRSAVREHDVVTRYGGDEFAVVFWDNEAPRAAGSRHPRDVLPLIERFRESLRKHDLGRAGGYEAAPITISGGLATFPDDAADGPELIARADQALITAKKEGKNAIFFGEGGGARDAHQVP